MKIKTVLFLLLAGEGLLVKLSCLDRLFYLFLAGVLVKFKLSGRTVN